MNAGQVILEARQQSVHLSVDGDKLRYRGPAEFVDGQLLGRLSKFKKEVIPLLTELCDSAECLDQILSAPATPPSQDSIRDFDESAMLRIEHGGAVRIWSTVFACWIAWVRDDDVAESAIKAGCSLPIYTVAELEIVKHWPPEQLRFAHEVKTLMGATIQPIPTEEKT